MRGWVDDYNAPNYLSLLQGPLTLVTGSKREGDTKAASFLKNGQVANSLGADLR